MQLLPDPEQDVRTAGAGAMKTCTKCGVLKPLPEFSVDKRASSGTQSACRECCALGRKARAEKDRAAAARWRKENADHVRQKQCEYAARTVARRRALERKRYANDRDAHLLKAQRMREKHRDELNRRQRVRAGKDRAEMAPNYVAKVLGLGPEEIPPDLLELKREQLATRRLARQLRRAIDETISEHT